MIQMPSPALPLFCFTTRGWKAMVFVFPLDDPNALTGTSPVLFYNTWLEGNGLRKISLHVFRTVIPKGVRKAKIHVLDLAKCIFRTHFCHHIGRWPNRDAFCEQLHISIEFVLVSTSSIDVAGVASNYHCIKFFHTLHELVMLRVNVIHNLATHASLDHAVCHRNGIEAVFISKLVAAA